MALHDELRALADQFNRIIADLPKAAEGVTAQLLSPLTLQATPAKPPTFDSLLKALGESLTLEQQLWLSRPENMAKLEPFLRSPQGHALVGAWFAQLRTF